MKSTALRRRFGRTSNVAKYRGHTIKVYAEDGDWIAEIAKIGDREGRMPQFGLTREVALQRAKDVIDKMCHPKDRI